MRVCATISIIVFAAAAHGGDPEICNGQPDACTKDPVLLQVAAQAKRTTEVEDDSDPIKGLIGGADYVDKEYLSDKYNRLEVFSMGGMKDVRKMDAKEAESLLQDGTGYNAARADASRFDHTHPRTLVTGIRGSTHFWSGDYASDGDGKNNLEKFSYTNTYEKPPQNPPTASPKWESQGPDNRVTQAAPGLSTA